MFRIDSQKGVTLYLGLMIMTIMLAMGLSLSASFSNELKMIKDMSDSVKAYYAADSAIELTLYKAAQGDTASLGYRCKDDNWYNRSDGSDFCLRLIGSYNNPNQIEVIGRYGNNPNDSVQRSIEVNLMKVFAFVIAKDSSNNSSLTVIDVSDPDDIFQRNSVNYNNEARSHYIDMDGIDILGNHAYVAGESTNSFAIFNIADLDDIKLANVVYCDGGIGSLACATLNDLDGAADVKVLGNYAYVVAKTSNSFVIFDISDRSDIKYVSTFNGNVAPHYLNLPTAIDVVGDFAYIATTDRGLTIFDISTPTAVSHKGVLEEADIESDCSFGSADCFNSANDIKVMEDLTGDDYAYILSNLGYYSVVDVENKTAPDFITNNTSFSGVEPRGLDVVGSYTYVVSTNNSGTNNFSIIHKDGVDPVIADRIITGNGSPNYLGGAEKISVLGDFAYIASKGDNALSIFDIFNVPAENISLVNVIHATLGEGINLWDAKDVCIKQVNPHSDI